MFHTVSRDHASWHTGASGVCPAGLDAPFVSSSSSLWAVRSCGAVMYFCICTAAIIRMWAFTMHIALIRHQSHMHHCKPKVVDRDEACLLELQQKIHFVSNDLSWRLFSLHLGGAHILGLHSRSMMPVRLVLICSIALSDGSAGTAQQAWALC